MATTREIPCNNGNYVGQKDEPTQTITGPPNPFSVIFKGEYNFFLCWYLHLSHNFNATALDVLYRHLSEAYQKYINGNHDDERPSDSDVCNGNNNDTSINGIMKIYNNSLIDSAAPNSSCGSEKGNPNRRLEEVIDVFIQLKETADLIVHHMAWLEELKLESLLVFPELYCKKPSSSVMSLMALCSKTRLFMRRVLELMKARGCNHRPQNPAKYEHVDEKFVKTYIPHYLKLESAKKPPVLKPCTCNARLNPALSIVNGDQKVHSAILPQIN